MPIETAGDITSAVKGIEMDLDDRDFTINAMAVDIDHITEDLLFAKQSIIDPYNGYRDLSAGLIKAVSETSLVSDPVRMMRAIRFSANPQFKIENCTQQDIKTNAILLKDVSPERARDEFLKILGTHRAYPSLILMSKMGITEQIIPELIPIKGVTLPPLHFGDVFDHTIETVGNLEKMIPTQPNFKNSDSNVFNSVPLFEGIEGYFQQKIGDGHTRLTACKLACLLHNIGKPSAQTENKDGSVRFLGHAEVGAEIATQILKRLRVSKTMSTLVFQQIKHHLRPSQLAPEGRLPSPKSIYRYYKDVGAAATDTLYLNMANYLSTKGPALKVKEWETYCEVIKHVINKGLTENSRTTCNKLLSGHDIMERLCLKPGPLIGVLLDKVDEARFEQKIKDKEDAIRFLENQLKSGE